MWRSLVCLCLLGCSQRALPLDGAASFSVGLRHACAVDGGRVRCWGANPLGQLGDGTRENRALPVDVAGIDDAIAVAAGDGVSCAQRQRGRVDCWGEGFGDPREVPELRGALRLVVGGDSVNALFSDGGVRFVARGVAGVVRGVAGAVDLDGEDDRYCALTGDGVLCWTFSVRDFPVEPWRESDAVPGARRLAIGREQRCFLDGEGVVSCEGKVAPDAALPGRARDLAVGGWRGCALLDDGSVWCWGLAPNFDSRPELTPAPVAGLPRAVAVDTRQLDGCARSDDGLWCWGDNSYGQIGDGTHEFRAAAAEVALRR